MEGNRQDICNTTGRTFSDMPVQNVERSDTSDTEDSDGCGWRVYNEHSNGHASDKSGKGNQDKRGTAQDTVEHEDQTSRKRAFAEDIIGDGDETSLKRGSSEDIIGDADETSPKIGHSCVQGHSREKYTTVRTPNVEIAQESERQRDSDATTVIETETETESQASQTAARRYQNVGRKDSTPILIAFPSRR